MYSLFQKHPTVCTDTRKIEKGCLFFALKGDTFDANDFALEALEKGAAYAVVDRPGLVHPQFVNVPDVLKALQELAFLHRCSMKIPVIGLTGSNGKTTTKELIYAVLAAQYRVTATQGNLNNHIGVPLSILQMTRETQIGLFEMGASHPGEIEELTAIVRPIAGLITNIGKAHLEGFGNLEGVMACKGALYDFLLTHKGHIVYNQDDPVLVEMLRARNAPQNLLCPYGAKTQKVKTGTENGALFLEIDGYPGIQTQLIGSFNVNNVLAALAFGEMFGVEREKAAAAIAAYKPSNNRSQWMETPYNALVVDAYNANPTSMAASLEDFKKLGATNKCLILGDMRELGDASLQEHLKIVEYVRDMPVQQVFWVGPWFTKAAGQMKAPGLCFPNVEALIGHLEKHPLRHTTTLIKGSNGIRLTKIISSEVC